MSYCTNCGSELSEGTAFCSNCGAAQTQSAYVPQQEIVEQPAPAPVYPEPVYTYSEPAATAAEPGALPISAKIMSIISMVCGILSCTSCYVGFLYSIPALILASIANKKAPGVPNKMTKVGKTTGIIGIGVSVLCLIAYVVMMAFTIGSSVEAAYEFSNF